MADFFFYLISNFVLAVGFASSGHNVFDTSLEAISWQNGERILNSPIGRSAPMENGQSCRLLLISKELFSRTAVVLLKEANINCLHMTEYLWPRAVLLTSEDFHADIKILELEPNATRKINK